MMVLKLRTDRHCTTMQVIGFKRCALVPRQALDLCVCTLRHSQPVRQGGFESVQLTLLRLAVQLRIDAEVLGNSDGVC